MEDTDYNNDPSAGAEFDLEDALNAALEECAGSAPGGEVPEVSGRPSELPQGVELQSGVELWTTNDGGKASASTSDSDLQNFELFGSPEDNGEQVPEVVSNIGLEHELFGPDEGDDQLFTSHPVIEDVSPWLSDDGMERVDDDLFGPSPEKDRPIVVATPQNKMQIAAFDGSTGLPIPAVVQPGEEQDALERACAVVHARRISVEKARLFLSAEVAAAAYRQLQGTSGTPRESQRTLTHNLVGTPEQGNTAPIAAPGRSQNLQDASADILPAVDIGGPSSSSINYDKLAEDIMQELGSELFAFPAAGEEVAGLGITGIDLPLSTPASTSTRLPALQVSLPEDVPMLEASASADPTVPKPSPDPKKCAWSPPKRTFRGFRSRNHVLGCDQPCCAKVPSPPKPERGPKRRRMTITERRLSIAAGRRQSVVGTPGRKSFARRGSRRLSTSPAAKRARIAKKRAKKWSSPQAVQVETMFERVVTHGIVTREALLDSVNALDPEHPKTLWDLQKKLDDMKMGIGRRLVLRAVEPEGPQRKRERKKRSKRRWMPKEGKRPEGGELGCDEVVAAAMNEGDVNDQFILEQLQLAPEEIVRDALEPKGMW